MTCNSLDDSSCVCMYVSLNHMNQGQMMTSRTNRIIKCDKTNEFCGFLLFILLENKREMGKHSCAYVMDGIDSYL